MEAPTFVEKLKSVGATDEQIEAASKLVTEISVNTLAALDASMNEAIKVTWDYSIMISIEEMAVAKIIGCMLAHMADVVDNPALLDLCWDYLKPAVRVHYDDYLATGDKGARRPLGGGFG